MHLKTLHNKIINDALEMHSAIKKVLPRNLPKRYTGNFLYFSSFIDRLNAVTVPLKVCNQIIKDEDGLLKPNELQMTAEWKPKSETTINRRSPDIYIQWHINSSTRRFPITKAGWKRRRFYFWAYLMHELAHRHQDTSRPVSIGSKQFAPITDDKELWERQMYLGDFDEIEAYAHDVALEMIIWFPKMTYREAFKKMKMINRGLVRSTYPIFADAFEETPTHPAMLVLRKKIRAWYRLMNEQRDAYRILDLEPLRSTLVRPVASSDKTSYRKETR